MITSRMVSPASQYLLQINWRMIKKYTKTCFSCSNIRRHSCALLGRLRVHVVFSLDEYTLPLFFVAIRCYFSAPGKPGLLCLLKASHTLRQLIKQVSNCPYSSQVSVTLSIVLDFFLTNLHFSILTFFLSFCCH